MDTKITQPSWKTSCLRDTHVKCSLITMALKKAEPGIYPTMEYIIPTNREKFGSYLTAQPNSWVSPSTTCYTRAQTRLTLWWEFFQDFAKTGCSNGWHRINVLLSYSSRPRQFLSKVSFSGKTATWHVNRKNFEWSCISLEPFRHQLVQILRSVRQLKIISTAFLEASLTVSKGIFLWTTA